ncbi:MAG TPA: GNAT family N-acetyltransferase [Thermodesulfovibrionales bacterium]|nr:GNAT family N-acetyltransferase [Thermodesulfovibrionales bacterium]
MQELQTFPLKNGEEITLRPAAPGDSGGIISTLRSASPERSYVLMEQYGKNAETEGEYIRKMDPQKNLFLVAAARDAIVGSLAALQADGGHRPETAHVLNIGLHLAESFRGLGIGSRMVQYAIEWAREHGFKKMEASIFTTNKRSLNLFRKAGFTEECMKLKKFRIGRDYIDEACVGKWLE